MNPDATTPDTGWNELSPGAQIDATVLMASGFVVRDGQTVRERYRVERTLGEGAMGQVLAVTLLGSGDERTYALKVVARPADADRDGALDEQEREESGRQARWFAEILRQEAAKQDVVHRHGVSVARLFALVRLDDGSIGLRMELARGRSIEARIADEAARHASEPPDVMGAVTTVRKLVSQLRRLHEMVEPGFPTGFVHSDIKPGNVFVDDSDPSDLLVTLVDFGVATAGHAMVHDLALQHGSRKTFVLQQTGGTLGYAPPTHFSSKPTPLSDVHAAIVILYELITLELPWHFGELSPTPENIPAIEAAMKRGPRPVRDVRPSVRLDLASRLDEFFTHEFAQLHDLADAAAHAAAGSDEEVRRATTERLTRLAREFQGKLDLLARRLAPSLPPEPLDGLGLHDRTTVPTVQPPALRLPRSEPPADVRIGAGLGASQSEPPPETDGPMLELEPARPWMRRGPWLARAAALLGIGLLASAAVIRWMRPAPAPAPVIVPLAPDGGVATAAVAPPPRDAASTAGPDAGPIAPGSAPAVSLDDIRAAPVVAPPVSEPARSPTRHGRPRARPPALPAGAQRCTCIAPVAGARVVARGGALTRPVVVCSTSEAAGGGRAEFLGRGMVRREVFNALPTFRCDGAEGLELSVQRYSGTAGAELLLRCRRAATPSRGNGERPGGSAEADGGTHAASNGTHGNDAAVPPAAHEPDGSTNAGATPTTVPTSPGVTPVPEPATGDPGTRPTATDAGGVSGSSGGSSSNGAPDPSAGGGPDPTTGSAGSS